MTFVSPGASGLAHSQCSSASMSSSRLFLGRLLSSRACFHFAGHERFSKTKPSRTMIFQRTATTPLTPCLSPRVHSNCPLPLQPHPQNQPNPNGEGTTLKPDISLATKNGHFNLLPTRGGKE